MKFKYGITIAERDAMIASQGNTCATCPHVHDDESRETKLVVDHNHLIVKGMAVRECLCTNCNLACGFMKDEVASMRLAQVYIQRVAVLSTEIAKSTNQEKSLDRQEWTEKNPGKQYDKRETNLRERYGICGAQKRTMSIHQDHRCLICSKKEELVVDHDHVMENEVGKNVRGLICLNCNCAIGDRGFRENHGIIDNLIAYIEKWTIIQQFYPRL